MTCRPEKAPVALFSVFSFLGGRENPGNCRTIMIEDSFYYMVIYVSTMTDDLNIDIRNNT